MKRFWQKVAKELWFFFACYYGFALEPEPKDNNPIISVSLRDRISRARARLRPTPVIKIIRELQRSIERARSNLNDDALKGFDPSTLIDAETMLSYVFDDIEQLGNYRLVAKKLDNVRRLLQKHDRAYEKWLRNESEPSRRWWETPPDRRDYWF